MDFGTIAEALFGFLVIMLLAGIIFFRVRIGGGKPGNTESAAYRRNSIVVLFIILFFFIVWFSRIMKGLGAQEFQGGKLVLLIVTVLTGAASVALIVYGNFRKKK